MTIPTLSNSQIFKSPLLSSVGSGRGRKGAEGDVGGGEVIKGGKGRIRGNVGMWECGSESEPRTFHRLYIQYGVRS